MTMTYDARASRIAQLSNDLLAVIHPMTGTRALGTLRVRRSSPAVAGASVPSWRTLHPIVNGQIRYDMPFRISPTGGLPSIPGEFIAAPSDAPAAPLTPPFSERVFPSANAPRIVSDAHALSDGHDFIDLQVYSLVGGERHNLPLGTKFRFETQPLGVSAEAELVAPAVGASSPDWFGGVMSAVHYEQMTSGTKMLDAFRSVAQRTPSVVLAWDNSTPADGSTLTSTSRGSTRVGRATQLFMEAFTMFVLVQRADADSARRGEGFQVLDDLTWWLSDRQSVDGRPFSSPTGIQITSRGRLPSVPAEYQQLYVYVLRFTATHTLCPRPSPDLVVYPWLRSHYLQLQDRKAEDGSRIKMVDTLLDQGNPPE